MTGLVEDEFPTNHKNQKILVPANNTKQDMKCYLNASNKLNVEARKHLPHCVKSHKLIIKLYILH